MATTPEYFGTDAADNVTRDAVAPGTFWAHYLAKGGDDRIVWANGQVVGGAGNDTIIRLPTENGSVYAAYWDSPKAVYVDLDAGYALDGWGTRDTLVNINAVSGSGKNDTILGSSGDDFIDVNWGLNYVDGRGGIDSVGMDGVFSDWTFTVSVDGRMLTVARTNDPAHRTSELHNIEKIRFWTNNDTLLVTDLIDSAQKGPQTLIESPAIRWNAGQPLGSAATLTYSFTNSVPGYGAGAGGAGAQAWTSSQQAAVRAELSLIASATQLTLIEVSDSATAFGQLRFGINTQNGTAGYSYSPDPVAGNLAGDVWLSTTTAANLAPDGSGSIVLLRELGHALGLKQPLTEAYSGVLPVLINAENDTRYTVMSATDVMNGVPRDSFGAYDLAALRALYGSRVVGAGDSNYSFSDAAGRVQTLIADDAGNNSLSASAASVGAHIDLRPGKLSSIGRDAQDLAVIDNVSIAFGTAVNTATGSHFDDVIIGNANDNVLEGLGGNDLIDGGAGTDTAIFSGTRADYTVYQSTFSGNLIVSALDGMAGTSTLLNMERLVFSDMSVNLGIRALSKTIRASDLQTLEELYVGFFNRVPDADGLSYWIGQLAGGKNIGQIGDAFYNAAIQFSTLTGYSPGMSNADFLAVVYKNVLGRSSVDQAGLDYWTNNLASGVATRGSLVASILTSAHTFKGDASFGYVADLLDNKLAVATVFAIGYGLSYNSSESSIVNGMGIAAAVTATDMSAALTLIGMSDSPIAPF